MNDQLKQKLLKRRQIAQGSIIEESSIQKSVERREERLKESKAVEEVNFSTKKQFFEKVCGSKVKEEIQPQNQSLKEKRIDQDDTVRQQEQNKQLKSEEGVDPSIIHKQSTPPDNQCQLAPQPMIDTKQPQQDNEWEPLENQSQLTLQDQFQSIISSQSQYNQATIRQSYLPLQQQKSFSHALLKANLAAYLKNYLMNKTNIMMNSEIHVKRKEKHRDQFSFPSMSNQMRPKNFNRALYFDSSADVISSFFNSSQSRASKALAESHNQQLENFKRKVKASKTQNGYLILYDWTSDSLSLKHLQQKLSFIPNDQSWIFLNHSRIRKCLQKLSNLLSHSKKQQDDLKCQQLKRRQKVLKDKTRLFFSLPAKERNNTRKQIQEIIDLTSLEGYC